MYRNTKYAILFPIILALGVIFGLIMGRVITQNSLQARALAMADGYNVPQNKLLRTMSLIERNYVDSVSLDSLSEQAIPLLIERLDPHSAYIPSSGMEEASEMLEGEFDGIGVVFNMATDTAVVLNVIPSGPSAKVGVQPGDRILYINDSLVAGRKIPNTDIVKQLRGKRGSKVRLGLHRGGVDDVVKVEITRDAIPIKSLTASFMITPRIGFVKLEQFSRSSYKELKAALAQLRKAGMTKLILDLRDNTGGFLDQAILIANEFLPKGELIVYTQNRAGEQVKQYSDGRGGSTDIEMVVLINEGSASSSEILAGAIQDNDRGTIVGRRSFGKGLVQEQFDFNDGSALRLTVARYYTPTGRSIQKPYKSGDALSYELDIVNRYKHNEFFVADSIKFADSLKYTTPKGKTVYGGGGIMPDVFVPLDTTRVTKYYVDVAGRSLIHKYAMEYADRNRAELNAVETLAQLQRFLNRDKMLFPDFVMYAERQGVKRPSNRELQLSRPLIEAQLRALIGRNTVLEDVGFYVNIYPQDEVIGQSMKILKKERR